MNAPTAKPQWRPDWRPDEAKLRELILYVAAKSRFDRHFGRTKLQKILFHSEFRAFQREGRPITGATYRRLTNGPVLRRFLPILRQIENARDAVEEPVEVGDLTRNRLVPLRKPKLSSFTADEIAIVDEVIEELWHSNARDVSTASHDHPGWMLVDDGDEIPYFAALLPSRPTSLSEDEIEEAQQFFASR